MKRDISVPKLDLMISRFKSRSRDFVFLVDQFSYFDSFSKHEMRHSLKKIFDSHVSDTDRICLIKFTGEKFIRTVFSLVRKDSNLIQLRN